MSEYMQDPEVAARVRQSIAEGEQAMASGEPMTTLDGMNLVHHEHPLIELDAPAWDTERLVAHLAEMHDLTVTGRDVAALAAIHAAEHPTLAGIEHGD